MLRDRDIREPLFEFLEETYGKIRIIEEKIIGRSRADVVMVTEEAVCGIEIKSDADSYARLAGQVRDYSLYFDYVFIAAGTRHALHVEEHVPDWWGIITVDDVDGTPDFYLLRKPRPNPEADPAKKLAFLWRMELEQILLANGLPKYTSFSKKKIRERLLARVPAECLNRQISEQLLERDYTKLHEQRAVRKPGSRTKKAARKKTKIRRGRSTS